MNVLHIGQAAYIIHHYLSITRPAGAQVQVWTRLGILLTMKIHNFFHIHLLLPYRVMEAYITSHS